MLVTVYVTLPIGVPNMTTTIELLDAAKRAAGCGTDYQFAKANSLTLATVSRWLHVAALLAAVGLPPAHGAELDDNAYFRPSVTSNLTIMRSIEAALRRFLFGDWLRLA